jgi:hypothetical protein
LNKKRGVFFAQHGRVPRPIVIVPTLLEGNFRPGHRFLRRGQPDNGVPGSRTRAFSGTNEVEVSAAMHSVFYIIGVVVVVLAILSLLGLA